MYFQNFQHFLLTYDTGIQSPKTLGNNKSFHRSKKKYKTSFNNAVLTVMWNI